MASKAGVTRPIWKGVLGLPDGAYVSWEEFARRVDEKIPKLVEVGPDVVAAAGPPRGSDRRVRFPASYVLAMAMPVGSYGSDSGAATTTPSLAPDIPTGKDPVTALAEFSNRAEVRGLIGAARAYATQGQLDWFVNTFWCEPSTAGAADDGLARDPEVDRLKGAVSAAARELFDRRGGVQPAWWADFASKRVFSDLRTACVDNAVASGGAWPAIAAGSGTAIIHRQVGAASLPEMLPGTSFDSSRATLADRVASLSSALMWGAPDGASAGPRGVARWLGAGAAAQRLVAGNGLEALRFLERAEASNIGELKASAGRARAALSGLVGTACRPGEEHARGGEAPPSRPPPWGLALRGSSVCLGMVGLRYSQPAGALVLEPLVLPASSAASPGASSVPGARGRKVKISRLARVAGGGWEAALRDFPGGAPPLVRVVASGAVVVMLTKDSAPPVAPRPSATSDATAGEVDALSVAPTKYLKTVADLTEWQCPASADPSADEWSSEAIMSQSALGEAITLVPAGVKSPKLVVRARTLAALLAAVGIETTLPSPLCGMSHDRVMARGRGYLVAAAMSRSKHLLKLQAQGDERGLDAASGEATPSAASKAMGALVAANLPPCLLPLTEVWPDACARIAKALTADLNDMLGATAEPGIGGASRPMLLHHASSASGSSRASLVSKSSRTLLSAMRSTNTLELPDDAGDADGQHKTAAEASAQRAGPGSAAESRFLGCLWLPVAPSALLLELSEEYNPSGGRSLGLPTVSAHDLVAVGHLAAAAARTEWADATLAAARSHQLVGEGVPSAVATAEALGRRTAGARWIFQSAMARGMHHPSLPGQSQAVPPSAAHDETWRRWNEPSPDEAARSLAALAPEGTFVRCLLLPPGMCPAIRGSEADPKSHSLRAAATAAGCLMATEAAKRLVATRLPSADAAEQAAGAAERSAEAEGADVLELRTTQSLAERALIGLCAGGGGVCRGGGDDGASGATGTALWLRWLRCWMMLALVLKQTAEAVPTGPTGEQAAGLARDAARKAAAAARFACAWAAWLVGWYSMRADVIRARAPVRAQAWAHASPPADSLVASLVEVEERAAAATRAQKDAAALADSTMRLATRLEPPAAKASPKSV